MVRSIVADEIVVVTQGPDIAKSEVFFFSEPVQCHALTSNTTTLLVSVSSYLGFVVC